MNKFNCSKKYIGNVYESVEYGGGIYEVFSETKLKKIDNNVYGKIINGKTNTGFIVWFSRERNYVEFEYEAFINDKKIYKLIKKGLKNLDDKINYKFLKDE